VDLRTELPLTDTHGSHLRTRCTWRIPRAVAVLGLLVACDATGGDPAVHRSDKATQAIDQQDECQPGTLLLPTRTATESSEATAINDHGWVAGWVGEVLKPSSAVLWRDNGPPIDLGVRGVPYDINDDGAIAINGDGSGAKGLAAFLWKDGTVRRLRGTKSRPHVRITALNDHDVVVGTVFRLDTGNDRAAIWRNGKLHMLAPRAGAKHEMTFGQDINNSGLVIGWGGPSPGPNPWWWKGRRIETLSRGDSGRGFATHIDDRGRVVGFVQGRTEDDPGGPALKWRSVHARPRKFLKRTGFSELHASEGYLVGGRSSRASGGMSRAFVAHLTSDRLTYLPDPPAPSKGLPVDFTDATDVAVGPSPFAPDGGVTVAGSVYYASDGEGGGRRAVLWTCAQTSR
jgi:uncharacterized membrane protein